LVQAIDVLRHNGGYFAHGLHLCDGVMGGIGAGAKDFFRQRMYPIVKTLWMLLERP